MLTLITAFRLVEAMKEEIPCPYAVEAGGGCMDTVEVPGRLRNTFKGTPDKLDEDVRSSLRASMVTTCALCGEDYTIEYYPE